MDSRRTALIVAPPDDLHALTVAWEVKQLGGTPLILNLADFPTRWKMSMTASTGGAQSFRLCTPDGDHIDDAMIAGVWWRRTQAHKIAAEVTDKEQRAFCAAEARALFEGWIYSLGDRVINPLAADLAARRKPYQLAVAARMGLTIPDTIITNDYERLTAFIAPERGPRIFKTLTPMLHQLTETRVLDEAAQSDLHLVELAPVIFQQRIDGGPDIRVTVVDGELFAAEMQADHPEAWLDWRLDPDIDCAPYGLPAAVADNIMSLQRALGLRYGAYDLRRNENGEHVFFEVNPGGQYLFVEISTGHQISRAIARALVG